MDLLCTVKVVSNIGRVLGVKVGSYVDLDGERMAIDDVQYTQIHVE